jgi:hypothetical protein
LLGQRSNLVNLLFGACANARRRRRDQRLDPLERN